MTRIWTIQPIQVWRLLRKQQPLYVHEKCDWYRGYVPPAYRWLQSQLGGKLGTYSGHLPWWAHCHKPDLRTYRHGARGLHAGTMEVRLELEIADDSFLGFPCWAWNRVFCQDYLAATRQEYEGWTRALRRAVPDEDVWPLPEPWRSQLEASWQRLFDPDLPALDWDEDSLLRGNARREGVFESLRLDDVRRVTTYKLSFPSENNKTKR